MLPAAALAACGHATPPREILLHRVELTLRPDGLLDVSEHITARFAEGQTSFHRHVASGRFDDTFDISATFDGRPMHEGTRPPGVDVTGGRSLDATWTFTAVAAEGPHTLTLRYRVAGALQLEGRQRRLTWRAFESGRALPISVADVTLQPPPGVAVLMPSGMAEAGWKVSTSDGRLLATRDNLPAAEPGTVLALLSGDALPLHEPRWQFDTARTGELAPAFLAGGAFIIVVALGIVGMLWWHDRRSRPSGRRQQLRVTAVVVFLSGVACAVTVWLLLARLGWWPHAIGLSLGLSALVFLAMSLRYRS